MPSPDNLREYMRRLTARPHHVGSPYDKDNAEWILAQFKSWGLDAHIETFDVLFPTPKDRLLEMVEPTNFTAKLAGAAGAGDPTSNQQAEQLPTYNAYSIDGDVTAPLVYVNYGIPDDYEQLDRMGISVKGAIVIARYGRSWRGIKPKVAAEHGAVGCIIYSDPQDDGYARRRCLPGGAGPPGGRRAARQRDGYRFYSRRSAHAGRSARPQTPSGCRSKTAKSITKIPVLPISYGDAQPLLAALKGPSACPEEWRGACPSPITSGRGRRRFICKVAIQLGHQAALRCDRAHPRLANFPTNGSSAAIIMTRG